MTPLQLKKKNITRTRTFCKAKRVPKFWKMSLKDLLIGKLLKELFSSSFKEKISVNLIVEVLCDFGFV